MPKGYNTPEGYYGWIPWEDIWMLFPTQSEYYEYLKEAQL